MLVVLSQFNCQFCCCVWHLCAWVIRSRISLRLIALLKRIELFFSQCGIAGCSIVISSHCSIGSLCLSYYGGWPQSLFAKLVEGGIDV